MLHCTHYVQFATCHACAEVVAVVAYAAVHCCRSTVELIAYCCYCGYCWYTLYGSLALYCQRCCASHCKQVVKADNEGMNQVMTGMENQLKAYAAKEEATNQLVKESIIKVLTVLNLTLAKQCYR